MKLLEAAAACVTTAPALRVLLASGFISFRGVVCVFANTKRWENSAGLTTYSGEGLWEGRDRGREGRGQFCRAPSLLTTDVQKKIARKARLMLANLVPTPP